MKSEENELIELPVRKNREKRTLEVFKHIKRKQEAFVLDLLSNIGELQSKETKNLIVTNVRD